MEFPVASRYELGTRSIVIGARRFSNILQINWPQPTTDVCIHKGLLYVLSISSARRGKDRYSCGKG